MKRNMKIGLTVAAASRLAEAAEGNHILLVKHVLEVSLGLAELHVLQSHAGLTSVLQKL